MYETNKKFGKPNTRVFEQGILFFLKVIEVDSTKIANYMYNEHRVYRVYFLYSVGQVKLSDLDRLINFTCSCYLQLTSNEDCCMLVVVSPTFQN